MRVLAIESSTSSAKALIFDSDKGIVSACEEPYPTSVSENGRSDPRGVLEYSCRAAAQALGALCAGGKKPEIDAVSLCGVWQGLCVLSGDMEPCSPVYSWNFTGAAPLCARLRRDRERTEWLYRRTGCMPHSGYPRHVIQYLRQEGAELSDKRFITQGAYNFYRLTGCYEETACMQSGGGLVSLTSGDYDAEILDWLGIRREQLGQLTGYRSPRPLSAAGAGLLGLPAGTPVVPAHADGALNQIGNYAAGGGVMTLSVGTSGALRLAADQPALSDNHALWCYRGADAYLTGAATSGAGNCIGWFRDKMAAGCSYGELEDAADELTELPVFLPFLYGERSPGWRDDRRGAFRELLPQHGLREMYKAVQMGVLFHLKQCFDVLRESCGTPSEIIVSGGITKSEVWLRMLADIFEQDILVSDFPHASMLGAAALGLAAGGVIGDPADFAWGKDRLILIRSREEKQPFYCSHYRKYMDAYGESAGG
ncbi:gluconokinase [Lachnoclostridium sp. Marseille-P6806]|uniref:gluconokinase n=1 Tax=Lachnoclostridium sp. Marseille-P6806 TaxID=2364793 RepID=UPI001030689F|nr:FGGY-family carbohydrate kinase [Lachnoclostridium sp. Marseille-P6806]